MSIIKERAIGELQKIIGPLLPQVGSYGDVRSQEVLEATAHEAATAAYTAILEVLASERMVMRDGGGVIHEIRGEPNDVWQAMLAGLQE